METRTKKDITKKDIRREILGIRDRMSQKEWEHKSGLIRDRLLGLSVYISAEHILCYVNYKREVETVSLIGKSLAEGKHVYCPLVSGKEMDFYEIRSAAELQPGFHGILEPPMRAKCRFEPAVQRAHVLMVMPGAAFDRAHHRIGYGGGYYDRYLHNAPDIMTAALAFSFQVRDSIPCAGHDICPRIILTEDGEI